MALGDKLKKATQEAKKNKKRVEKLIPMIQKTLDSRANLGYNNAEITLDVGAIKDEDWQFLLDWAIGEKIGIKKQGGNKYRFMW